MIRRLVVAGSLALVLAGTPFAQNARMNALAGGAGINDMSDVLYNPAWAVEYSDAVQATYSAQASPVIALKSVGDMVAFGGTYTWRPSVAGTPNPTPHLVLGADLGTFKAGLSAYYERLISGTKTESVSAAATVRTNSRTVNARPGLRAGVILDIDAGRLEVVAGASFPGSRTFTSTETEGVSSSESTVKSREMAFDAGAELTANAGSADLHLGVAGGLAFSGKTTTHTATTTVGGASTDTTVDAGTTDRDLGLGVYAGAVKDLEQHEALVAFRVSAGVSRSVTQPFEIDSSNYNPGKEGTNTLYLALHTAIEKGWSDLKRLDEVLVRTGLAYGVSTAITHEDGEAPGLLHMERTKNAASFSGVVLTVGTGLRKGAFSFDVEVVPSALVNVFKLGNGTFNAGGNDFASATLTFDFKDRIW